jgi:hypothetical protein
LTGATDWAAWVGAITGCLALGLEIVKAVRSGARITVTLPPWAEKEKIWGERPGYRVSVANRGDKATTINSAHLVVCQSLRDRLRGKTQDFSSIELTDELPQVLDPGHEWNGFLDGQIAAAANYMWVAIHHSEGRPVYARVKARRESGRQLGD